jgi:ABC-type amino acid transport substrate-binding protein
VSVFRHHIAQVAIGAALVLWAAGESKAAEDSRPPDIARIEAAGEIRVAMTPDDWPPFFYKHSVRGIAGMDVDLATEAARRLGVRVSFVREAQTFDDLVTMVVNRKVDIAISYLSDTFERAELVRFTRIYAQLKPALLINRSLAGQSHRGRDLSQLLNHPDATIGVTKGSSAESFAAADYPQAKIVSYDTWTEITDALANDKLLAGLSDQIDAQNWQAAHPEGAIAIETVVLNNQPDTLAIAVNREDRQLLYWLNHFLDRKERDGTLAALTQHYIENDSWKKDLR